MKLPRRALFAALAAPFVAAASNVGLSRILVYKPRILGPTTVHRIMEESRIGGATYRGVRMTWSGWFPNPRHPDYLGHWLAWSPESVKGGRIAFVTARSENQMETQRRESLEKLIRLIDKTFDEVSWPTGESS